MIIGFDSLQNNNENSDTLDFELEFVDYRKYFQRIYKGTDSLYADWLDEYKKKLKENKHIAVRLEETRESVINRLILQQAETKPNRIFVFGHSLDATDNEIFKDIFLRELNDTQITIYYHDLDSRKRIITNLIKILTKPILVQKTKGNNPDIKFVEQTYKRESFHITALFQVNYPFIDNRVPRFLVPQNLSCSPMFPKWGTSFFWRPDAIFKLSSLDFLVSVLHFYRFCSPQF